jgi:hypothetical protein
MTRKQFYLFAIVSVVLIFVFLCLVFASLTSKSSTSNPQQGQSSAGEKQPIKVPTSNNFGDGNDEATRPEPEKGEQISSLIDNIPYAGTYFSLAYNFNDAYFYAYIDPANKTEGDRQLDEFLKQNGIENRTTMPNLRYTTTKPSPTR